MKLSVVVITLNEDKDLARALQSVKSIACEIIVVDSGSTDKTLDIAKRFNAKIYTRKFDNFANQKNFAISKSHGLWILSLDADEVISVELAKEIEEKIGTDSDTVAYSIPRRNIILGKEIKYTRWQKELDRHVWLWKKGEGKWSGEVHEELRVSGKVGSLVNAKIHYQYKTVSEFLDMMNKYSTLDAQNKEFKIVNLFIQPTYNFLVRYFYRFGFLDGWRGFVLSFLMAMYHMEVQTKIWANSLKVTNT